MLLDELSFAILEQTTLGRDVQFQFFPGPGKFLQVRVSESQRGWHESVRDQHHGAVELEVADPRADVRPLSRILAEHIRQAGERLDRVLGEPGLTAPGGSAG